MWKIAGHELKGLSAYFDAGVRGIVFFFNRNLVAGVRYKYSQTLCRECFRNLFGRFDKEHLGGGELYSLRQNFGVDD